jgi:hypothetical protein
MTMNETIPHTETDTARRHWGGLTARQRRGLAAGTAVAA